MANTKVTMVTKFNAIIDCLEGRENSAMTKLEMIDFLKSRIDIINNKSSNRKQTATQKQNEIYKNIILKNLTSEPVTVSGILKTLKAKNPDFEDMSTQKMTSLLRSLKEDGKIDKKKDGKTTVFFLI